MNYRHAFHAGNFADVLKHAVLARVIAYMTRKPAPFRIIDTHAGIGHYDLASVEACKTGEWRQGIGRLLGPSARPISAPLKGLLAPYLDAVAAENGGPDLVSYPGSPRLALRLMRAHDTLVANELHPIDAAALKQAIGHDRRARILTLDAWVALRAQLPPKERRGLVLIDPPFEQPGEFERIALGLAEGLERFATGTFIAWYPIKDMRSVGAWQRTLTALKSDKLLAVDVLVQAARDPEALNGCGLFVVNGPFTLREDLELMLPELLGLLSHGAGASFTMTDVFSGKAVTRRL